MDIFTRLEIRKFTSRVAEIAGDEVRFSGGLITDLFGNIVKRPDGWVYSGAQFFIPEYSVGKKWTTRFRITSPKGGVGETNYEFKVVARENISVPAGIFEAYRVEGTGWSTVVQGSGILNLRNNYWIVPGIRRVVANEIQRIHSSGKIVSNERLELTAYTQL